MAQCAHIYRDTPDSREKGRVGRQCGQQGINETPFCKFHGGASEQVIDKYRRERYEAEIAAQAATAVRIGGFTDLWPESHEMLDPFSLLLWEIRRSGARIEWFDRKIDEIEEEKSIWWGITKSEVIGASEFAGTNKTYEARENVLVKMQNEERKRLQTLRDEWQNNRFEALKIAGYGAFRASMRQAIQALALEFAIDLSDPETQGRLRAVLEALPEPIVGMDAPEVKALNKRGLG